MIFFRKRLTIETILFLIYMSYHSNSGLEEMKEELRGFAHSEDEKLEAVVEAYADSHLVNAAKILMDQVQSEDEQLETRLHDWIDKHTKGGGVITPRHCIKVKSSSRPPPNLIPTIDISHFA